MSDPFILRLLEDEARLSQRFESKPLDALKAGGLVFVLRFTAKITLYRARNCSGGLTEIGPSYLSSVGASKEVS